MVRRHDRAMTGRPDTPRTTPRVGAAGAVIAAVMAAVIPPTAASTAATVGRPEGPPRWPVHSSDGMTGPLAEPLSRPSEATSETTVEQYRVVPGLRYRHWVRSDGRGTVHAYSLRANLARPGLSLEYAGGQHVSDRASLTSLLAADAAVAGVNADYFDIADTGAPLGVGIDDGRVLHGARRGWTTSFRLTEQARARIGPTSVVAEIVGRPRLRIATLNAPHVPPGGIGLYTPRWGDAPGYAVTDSARRRDVRQVVIRQGRVVRNSRSVARGTAIDGRILLGRGAGAVDLARRLPVGSTVRFDVSSTGSPRVAVSGRQVLVAGGEVVTTDDTELHPRTAVGIDADTGAVLLVVVDGRSEASAGYTLLQLAHLMVQLGSEEALNLDGGGSSTMAVTPPGGALSVTNSPSDGDERPIPEGLQLVDAPPTRCGRDLSSAGPTTHPCAYLSAAPAPEPEPVDS